MKVFIIDSQDFYEGELYLVEHVVFDRVALSVEAMQALLDLKWGPPKAPPPAGSGEWRTYRSGLHKVVATGDIDWLGGPFSENREPTEFRNFIEGIEYASSEWMADEHREAGRRLTAQLPAQLRKLLPDLLIHGTAVTVDPTEDAERK